MNAFDITVKMPLVFMRKYTRLSIALCFFKGESLGTRGEPRDEG